MVAFELSRNFGLTWCCEWVAAGLIEYPGTLRAYQGRLRAAKTGFLCGWVRSLTSKLELRNLFARRVVNFCDTPTNSPP